MALLGSADRLDLKNDGNSEGLAELFSTWDAVQNDIYEEANGHIHTSRKNISVFVPLVMH